MKTWTGLFAVLLITAMAMGALAQPPQPAPGVVDIDDPPLFEGMEAAVETFLEAPLLKMMTAAAAEAQPDLAKAIPELHLVHVRIFEAVEQQDVEVRVTNLVDALKAKGWSTVIHMPKGRESADVLMKTDDERIAGVVVLFREPGALVFVNIAGDIEPETFGKHLGALAGSFMQGQMPLGALGGLLGGTLMLSNGGPGEPGGQGWEERPLSFRGTVVAALAEALEGAAQEVRRQAMPALTLAIREKDDRTRETALQEMLDLGPEAVPALRDALQDDSESLRRDAAQALGALGLDAREAIPDLLVTIRDTDDTVQRSAIESIGAIIRDADEALDPEARTGVLDLLTIVVNDEGEKPAQREEAARALSALGTEAVPGLLGTWTDKAHPVRWEAGEALGMMGAEAQQAIPEIAIALGDESDAIRRRALKSLGEILKDGGSDLEPPARQAAMTALFEVVNNPNEEAPQREEAARTLSWLAPEAIPRLIGIWGDRAHPVRWEAGQALGMMGPAAKEAVPALVAGLADESPAIRRRAIKSLSEIGRTAPPDSDQAADDLDAETRAAILSHISEMLSDDDYNVRRIAAERLGMMGPDAVPVLVKAMQDSQADVR